MSDVPKFSIKEYMETKGVYLNGDSGRRKVLCPFHGDTNPSATVDLDGDWFNCFACEAKGDVLDLIQRDEGVDFETALAEAKARFGEGSVRVRATVGGGHNPYSFRIFEV